MRTVKIFLLICIIINNIIKCEINSFENVKEITKSIDENIMNVLDSVSVSHSIKTEKNILNDLSNYMQFLKELSLLDIEDMEYEGFLNIDKTDKKRYNKNITLKYSSRNGYKNNINDVKKEVNKSLFLKN
ncbi:conserved Plasmodium protein, unknown function [Plasmodium gallinaceum]|uniref:Fam-b protein n=1 Tax=Plasmodium gallinaceum TaxID=5849 RepID=A0A1J1H038_PLAGA|nr:conserved Plasmodium protein, unknown function [Plasmodium gallinaceum]CRG98184.1 conserved Plasmodium protein, unknown function [Plasmodium gallinaceum]